MKKVYLLGVLSLIFTGCGGSSGDKASPKAAKISLDGEYELTQVACTVGELDQDFSAGLDVIQGVFLSLQGNSFKFKTVFDESCTSTENATIVELTDNKITVKGDSTEYSETCSAELKDDSPADNEPATSTYSVSGKTLTIIDADDEAEVCQDQDGVLVHTWSKI